MKTVTLDVKDTNIIDVTINGVVKRLTYSKLDVYQDKDGCTVALSTTQGFYSLFIGDDDELIVNGTEYTGNDLYTYLKDNVFFTASAGGGLPYKVYTALLSQSGTDAPTAVVLENTLGGEVVWSRDDVGRYKGTLSGAFIANKTICFGSSDANTGAGLIQIGRTNDNDLRVFNYAWEFVNIALYDGFGDFYIEIRVYP